MRLLTTLILTCIAPLALAAESKPAPVPMLPEMPNMHLLQVFLVLSFVIALIFLFAYLYQKISGMALQKNPALKIITGLSLGSRERIVVVQVGEQQILVGISQGAMRTLHVLDKPIDLQSHTSTGFSDLLKSKMQRGAGE